MTQISDAPEFRFSIDYKTRDGEKIGSLVCEPEWDRASAWLEHVCLRRDLPQDESAQAELDIEPIWHPTSGAPLCESVRVSITSGGKQIECALPVEYFRGVAELDAQQLVQQGKLAETARFLYTLNAYRLAASNPPPPGPAGGLVVEKLPTPLAVGEGCLDERLGAATERGDEAFDANDLPVFIPAKIVEEVTEIARAADTLESGGVLAGRLLRDPGSGTLFLDVTAAIPARHGEAGTGSFTFTPETWAAVDTALALRGGTETNVGSFHSHPNFCARCPEEQQRVCAFGNPFFSDDDKHLHRTIFPRGHQIALLISHLPGRGHVPALFGWRDAMVASRGYYELP